MHIIWLNFGDWNLFVNFHHSFTLFLELSVIFKLLKKRYITYFWTRNERIIFTWTGSISCLNYSLLQAFLYLNSASGFFVGFLGKGCHSTLRRLHYDLRANEFELGFPILRNEMRCETKWILERLKWTLNKRN
jgi:hypothetical protein